MSGGAAKLQREHYNRILSEYELHYGDPTSLEYRRRFFLDPLLEGIDLNDATVADLAAGSGYTTIELTRRFPRIQMSGFDVSDDSCAAYRINTGRPAQALDLSGGTVAPAAFDAAIVVGGLHHCVSDIPGTLRTIATMLKPGRPFFMVEPNRDCWLEPLRRAWYKQDGYFEESTEGALSHDALAAAGREWFTVERVHYLGGPAYFLIYNSLVLRVPLRLKSMVASPLFAMERAFNLLPGRYPYPFFVARWRRR